MKKWLIATLLFSLFTGCNPHKKNLKKYQFQDLGQKTIQIQSDFFHLSLRYGGVQKPETQKNSQKSAKNTLLFVFDLDDKSYQAYIDVLENLQKDYKDLRVIGVLDTHKDPKILQKFAQDYKIHFPILNPMDGKSLRADFSKILAQNAELEEQNSQAIDPNQNALAQNSTSQHSLATPTQNTLKNTAQNTQQHSEQKTPYPILGLPFLVLYDKNGQKVQYYEGSVVQEMFMHDLNHL
ncbi:TlpA family protein disulfide reductase [Helicobacter mustelae]|uniref:Putative outer membrane protein n=1 Tax=Helicobacter mustelae (strain ATCC 43772 / CCUG 25715 / CIP 103759 / LMG 18044 / NCTC 12198 / R85-136P) TaxID=679897 RepID=D3UJA6_HELM1|nr:outer membrane protein [Helicobacter mustelae]CBG40581.1 Putative outer membrane protein [Helicobacter mustelae 12198]SQH72078.1 outer membrane protein [Helicobacter mustelae]STP13222.1 outer membrane protein [Helicobacter mustelae]